MGAPTTHTPRVSTLDHTRAVAATPHVPMVVPPPGQAGGVTADTAAAGVAAAAARVEEPAGTSPSRPASQHGVESGSVAGGDRDGGGDGGGGGGGGGVGGDGGGVGRDDDEDEHGDDDVDMRPGRRYQLPRSRSTDDAAMLSPLSGLRVRHDSVSTDGTTVTDSSSLGGLVGGSAFSLGGDSTGMGTSTGSGSRAAWNRSPQSTGGGSFISSELSSGPEVGGDDDLDAGWVRSQSRRARRRRQKAARLNRGTAYLDLASSRERDVVRSPHRQRKGWNSSSRSNNNGTGGGDAVSGGGGGGGGGSHHNSRRRWSLGSGGSAPGGVSSSSPQAATSTSPLFASLASRYPTTTTTGATGSPRGTTTRRGGVAMSRSRRRRRQGWRSRGGSRSLSPVPQAPPLITKATSTPGPVSTARRFSARGQDGHVHDANGDGGGVRHDAGAEGEGGTGDTVSAATPPVATASVWSRRGGRAVVLGEGTPHPNAPHPNVAEVGEPGTPTAGTNTRTAGGDPNTPPADVQVHTLSVAQARASKQRRQRRESQTQHASPPPQVQGGKTAPGDACTPVPSSSVGGDQGVDKGEVAAASGSVSTPRCSSGLASSCASGAPSATAVDVLDANTASASTLSQPTARGGAAPPNNALTAAAAVTESNSDNGDGNNSSNNDNNSSSGNSNSQHKANNKTTKTRSVSVGNNGGTNTNRRSSPSHRSSQTQHHRKTRSLSTAAKPTLRRSPPRQHTTGQPLHHYFVTNLGGATAAAAAAAPSPPDLFPPSGGASTTAVPSVLMRGSLMGVPSAPVAVTQPPQLGNHNDFPSLSEAQSMTKSWTRGGKGRRSASTSAPSTAGGGGGGGTTNNDTDASGLVLMQHMPPSAFPAARRQRSGGATNGGSGGSAALHPPLAGLHSHSMSLGALPPALLKQHLVMSPQLTPPVPGGPPSGQVLVRTPHALPEFFPVHPHTPHSPYHTPRPSAPVHMSAASSLPTSTPPPTSATPTSASAAVVVVPTPAACASTDPAAASATSAAPAAAAPAAPAAMSATGTAGVDMSLSASAFATTSNGNSDSSGTAVANAAARTDRAGLGEGGDVVTERSTRRMVLSVGGSDEEGEGSGVVAAAAATGTGTGTVSATAATAAASGASSSSLRGSPESMRDGLSVASSERGSVALSAATAPLPSSTATRDTTMILSPMAWLEYELHEELLAFARWCTHRALRRRPQDLAAVHRIHNIVSEVLPGSRVELFGSFCTGLSIPDSDLDLIVCSNTGAMRRVWLEKGAQSMWQCLVPVPAPVTIACLTLHGALCFLFVCFVAARFQA